MKIPSYQQLSKQQDEINNLPMDGSHLVIGPPGTGKSVMALYRAQMYKKGRRDVRLLVHSRLLSQYTQNAVRQLSIGTLVDTFHSWWTGFYQAHYRRRPPTLAPYVYDWPQILQQVNTDPPEKGAIPYLIIDEGQDLPREFYIVAQHLATHLTVFADENQRLTEHNSTLDDIRAFGGFGRRTHILDRNYRNTREIAELAAVFEQGLGAGAAKPPERRGPRPAMARHTTLNDAVQQIVRFERAYSDLEIGVFTPTKRVQKQFVNRLQGKTVSPIQSYVGGHGSKAEKLDFDTPGVKVINYPSTKGLEFDAVFVPELQRAWFTGPSVDMQLYVLLSRAREQLFLGYSGEGIPEHVKRFPDELLERQ